MMTDKQIRVFVGSHKRYADVEPALAFSIRYHAGATPIDVQFMRPDVLGVADTGCTGFTNLRWLVPQLAGGRGYAIYLDVDMIVLADLAELFKYREPGRYVCMANGATEVMVMDCAIQLDNVMARHKSALMCHAPLSPRIPAQWDVCDTWRDDAKIVHFTDLKAQPWFHEHPDEKLTQLWEMYKGMSDQCSAA